MFPNKYVLLCVKYGATAADYHCCCHIVPLYERYPFVKAMCSLWNAIQMSIVYRILSPTAILETKMTGSCSQEYF